MTNIHHIYAPQGRDLCGGISNTKTARYSHLTGKRKNTNLRLILDYIKMNGPTGKYDILTNALGKVGSKNSLRGYYCVYMRSMRDSGLLNYYNKTYHLTTLSSILTYTKQEAPELFL